MYGENFLIAAAVTTICSLVAFVLQKGHLKDTLEIFSTAIMFFFFYPFAIACAPANILLYYYRILRDSGVRGLKDDIISWFTSYNQPSTTGSTNGAIPTVPEVPEPDPTEGWELQTILNYKLCETF